ncbi:AAA family ATPase [Paucibacter sp. APW11]|uniref:AAA family ATPase n=1 Tax=Roseateles aquae TaxID=3077235 RepID=A0ABU3PIE7_9BURK|nr:AAA family ATPase [Paucibacter sp. APW11]MDT9002329.1 AAA family ATPase [Paucibacter sp. APW11]
MRLDRVYIDGFKNLKQLDLDFDETRLTTVLIGQNGAGKSNLIEALALVFSHVDLRSASLRFHYRVTYRIQARKAKPGELTQVVLSNMAGEAPFVVDGKAVSRAEFERNKSEWFPDLILGYYSGSGRRLERVFDKHQANYYKAIARNNDEEACYQALLARRLFYCRHVHGVMALLAQFAFPDQDADMLLKEIVRVTGFHSALTLFREPWYAKGGRSKKLEDAQDFWGAEGPAGRAARLLQSIAFHPFGLNGNAVDDYRDKLKDEAQFATFLRDQSVIQRLREAFSDDADMFYALEALDVSDLIRNLNIWVTRENDASGDIEYSDLSDGERQLLMVMGLLRVSRGKRVLFLLDEPDTHLNPHWQLSYLRLIERWTGNAADATNCHIVLSSHNPLTICGLTKSEVRVLFSEEGSEVTVAEEPFVDPRGLGIGGVLTDIFGMYSPLDQPTQELIIARNKLARFAELDEGQAQALERINEQLRELGFMYEERDALYRAVLREVDDVEMRDTTPRTPRQLRARDEMVKQIIAQLISQK